ncbi:MAG: lamin tail domain-containing protein, partial [Balneolaceae bacterium]
MNITREFIIKKGRVTLLLALFIFLIFPEKGESQQLVLNEVMSSNSQTIADEDGDYQDWIELTNISDEPINLSGYGLSDDYDDPFHWVFPNVTLQPNSYLLIWASNKHRTEPDGELHTNFAISAAGEEVILTHPDGTRIDELEPVEIPPDFSIGRDPDGVGNWVIFDEPTPGQSNIDGSTINLLEPPQFSHKAGFYTGDFMLEITHPEEDVTIYYTLDGSDPTTSSEVY